MPVSRSFLICFSTPRADISISIAISAADIDGLFLIKSKILSELFFFLSELFSELWDRVPELFLLFPNQNPLFPNLFPNYQPFSSNTNWYCCNSSSVINLLFNNAFAIIIMSLRIFKNKFFTCVRIAINTEMSTGIIHTNIFTNHTTTNLPLP